MVDERRFDAVFAPLLDSTKRMLDRAVMVRSSRSLVVLASLAGCFALAHGSASAVAGAPSAARLEAATALFKRYVALEQSFDPAAADLYADEAKIQNTRRYPSGEVKVMSLPAAKYKALIRSVMPAAKARGDRNSYSDVKYTTESDGIRVSAKRYSELKKYTSPLSILVKPTANGQWLIFEEMSESQP